MEKGAPSGGLLRLLGLGFGLAGAVGGTIGAGILRTPGLVAGLLDSEAAVLAAWIGGGLYALLGAVALAELGASLPRAGGWYVYARRAFGDSAGFVVGWVDWLGHCVGIAWVAITVGEYAALLVPALEGYRQPMALVVLLLFALIQGFGLRAGSGSQMALSLAKAAAFLVLIGACLLFGGDLTTGNPEPLAALAAAGQGPGAPVATHGTLGGAPAWIAVVLALQAVITTYDGWHCPVYFAEEFEEPARDLPRSLIGGVLAVTAIYVLFNLALLRVLPLPVLAGSTLPAAEAAKALLGPAGAQAISLLALISLLGLINASIMAAPRILYGLARDGLFAAGAARVSEAGTPTAALALTTLASGALVLGGSFATLLGIAAFLYVALYGSGIVALLVLRRLEPDLPRPFRAWGHPATSLLLLAGSLAFLAGALASDTADSLRALGLIALSLPIGWTVKRFEGQATVAP